MSRESEISIYRRLLTLESTNKVRVMLSDKLAPDQLQFNELNEKCYDEMYWHQRSLPKTDSRKVRDLKTQIGDLKIVCEHCARFYLPQRNKMIKAYDIQLGNKLQDPILDYLIMEGLDVREAHGSNPDLEVWQGESRIARLELKYQDAPFVYASRNLSSGAECYTTSLTLDTGEKFKRQMAIVKEDRNVPLFFVWWVDFPCLKGVFYMPLEVVVAYGEKMGWLEHKTKEREGHLLASQERKKIYPPVLEMGTLGELIEKLKKLTSNERNA